ncbi:MAG: hypothetical protein U0Y08_07510, partial [Bacteroidia bacterium]
MLISPSGNSLLLSSYNGNGGNDYHNCSFTYNALQSITSGNAPFTGMWIPQGGILDMYFSGENPNGNWTLMVIDTSCTNHHGGGGGTSSGYLYGAGSSGASSTMAFGSGSGPCLLSFTPISDSLCRGTTYNLAAPYQIYMPTISFQFFMNGTMLPDVTQLTQPGEYDIIAYDNSTGCTYSFTDTLFFHAPQPPGTDTSVFLNCTGAPMDLTSILTINSQIDWLLNLSPVTSQIVTSVNDTGQFTAIHTSSFGCKDTNIINTLQPASYNLGSDTTITRCSNVSANLNILYNTQGATTNWSYNNNTINNADSVFVAGDYTIIASDSGCPDTATVTLLHNQAPNMGTDQVIDQCQSASYDLTNIVNTSGFNAIWLLGASIPSNPANLVSCGPYSLIVTDVNACTDTVQIQINPLSVPTLGPDQSATICDNDPMDLTSGFNSTGLSVTWYYNNSITQPPYTAHAAGTYTITGTNSLGCTDTANFLLSVLPAPFIGNDTVINQCENQPVSAISLFNLNGGTAAWLLNNVTINTPQTIQITGLYEVIYTDGNGCADTGYADLTFLPSPNLGATLLDSICDGDSLQLQSLFQTNGYTTQWTYNGSSYDPTQAATIAGLYQLIATNSNGCSDTVDVDLKIFQPPSISAPIKINYCDGAIVNLENLLNTAGNTNIWTCNNLPFQNATNVTSGGIYALTATNITGCTSTSFADIQFNPTPVLGTDQQHEICENDSVSLMPLFNLQNLNVNWTLNG